MTAPLTATLYGRDRGSVEAASAHLLNAFGTALQTTDVQSRESDDLGAYGHTHAVTLAFSNSVSTLNDALTHGSMMAQNLRSQETYARVALCVDTPTDRPAPPTKRQLC